MIDILLAAIIGIVTWTVAAEGAWGAGTIFISVLLSGVVATNLFEPAANMLQSSLPAEWAHRCDFIALMGLFALCVFLLRFVTEKLAPSFIAVDNRAYNPLRWAFAFFSGYVTMAFVLTALHTAPLPREFLGFRPERKNFFGLSPDRDWLGFMQYVSERALPSSDGRIFDGATYSIPKHDNQVWPTFIIRYAARREDFGEPASPELSQSQELKPRSAAPSPKGSGI